LDARCFGCALFWMRVVCSAWVFGLFGFHLLCLVLVALAFICLVQGIMAICSGNTLLSTSPEEGTSQLALLLLLDERLSANI
jgi:hypothetical protein